MLDHLTDVGAYPNSVSAYGTLDQGGDVSQWNEARSSPNGYRGVRGRSFGGEWYDLGYSQFLNVNPAYEIMDIGFRVASVPEPGSMTLVVCGAIGFLIWWKRRS